MGIHGGASNIIDVLSRRALYNRWAARYNIYVDGEFMRYKGMNSETMSMANPAEAIADTALIYLVKLIESIKAYMFGELRYCYVFMDGARQEGKVQRVKSGDSSTNVYARDRWVLGLHALNCSVVELKHGEAELQMYIQRDKSVPLNVFVTNDSDMVSICYGHLPRLPVAAAKFNGSLAPGDMPIGNVTIIDPSYSYPEEEAAQVLDSCVWFNSCTDKLHVVGFDGTLIGSDGSSLGLLPRPFRCLVYLCGTDYSDHLLTLSMIDQILRVLESQTEAGREARITLNKLTDPLEMAAIYMFLAIRGGATVRQMKLSRLEPDFRFDPNVVSEAFEMYNTYVSTGTMGGDGKIIARPSGMLLSRELLYALYGQSAACSKMDKTLLLEIRTLDGVLDRFRSNFRQSYWIDSLSSEARDRILAEQTAKLPPAIFSNLGPHMNHTTELPAFRREFVVSAAAAAAANAAQAQSSKRGNKAPDSESDPDDDFQPSTSNGCKKRRPNPFDFHENDTQTPSERPESELYSPVRTSPQPLRSDSPLDTRDTGRVPDDRDADLPSDRK
jgi:hypothetical protein